MDLLDTTELKKIFPIFNVYPELCYLDSAASSLKPQMVIDKINYYYKNLNCNVQRGVYSLAYVTTDMYESTRDIVANFINANADEIIFTRGASQSLNIVASSYGMDFIEEGDEIITSELEHHSSHMPWLNVANKKKAKLKYVPLTKEGRITVENFNNILTDKTKLVAITLISNVLGYITPLKEIIEICHKRGIIVSVDAAQAVPHIKIDVKDLDCDFLSFSGHKMCGPTGIGVLFGKKQLLEKMNPIEFGGEMVDIVSKTSQSYKEVPYKFEAGTPPIAEVIGLSESCKLLQTIGLKNIENHEHILAKKAIELLKEIPDVEIYNKTVETGIVTFNIKGVHPHDAATIYDKNQVCVRAGNHCAQLITNFLGQIATTRASFYFYNDMKDVERLVYSVKEASNFFTKF